VPKVERVKALEYGPPEPSAREWLRRLGARELSARELTLYYLEKIRIVNPLLNAIVAQNCERTLADAERADAARTDGSDRPLLGLPVTVKDSIEVEGFESNAGSFAREGFVPRADATAVARLRAAGAIVLGKSNAPEYIASYETDNAISGRTNNPFALAHTAGGSSGGEASILGADASPAGIGSDGGGSIRVPAHYCGIVGLRPTVGLIPETGAWPSSRSSGLLDTHTIGPMARYVDDLLLLLEVMLGPDWKDPYAVPVPLGDAKNVDPAKLRLAFYTADSVGKPTPETEFTVSRAAEALAAMGSQIVPVTPPSCVSDATSLFFECAGADGGEHMRADLAPARGRHHPQMEHLMSARLSQPPPTAAAFFATLRRAHEFRARLRSFVLEFDALLCPVAAGPAPLHGTPPGGVALPEYFRYEAFNYTHTYSLAGLPVVVVPVGADPDGLPIGVQVVSGPYKDHIALAVAGLLENACGSFASLRPAPDAPRR
jgi:Asp-tRNA(Asn)/Glu-tRNA(Gln) amidotransferase A subunit family amidase